MRTKRRYIKKKVIRFWVGLAIWIVAYATITLTIAYKM